MRGLTEANSKVFFSFKNPFFLLKELDSSSFSDSRMVQETRKD